MEEQKTEVVLRALDITALHREIISRMEAGLNQLLLPADEYPEYVDIFVHYPEVMAKIRIVVKEQE